MDAECLGVTVDCTLNAAQSEDRAAEWGHFNEPPLLNNPAGWVPSSQASSSEPGQRRELFPLSSFA